MTVSVLAVILMRVLMVVVGVVLVRPRVWVGVTQAAVTVQVALDELIGRGAHGP